MNASEAAEWLRSKWADFRELDRHILDLQHAAAIAGAEARALGDMESYDTAQQTIKRLHNLKMSHDNILARFGQLREAVPGLGALVAVPPAYVAAVLALAAAVAWVFARFGAEARIVGLLETGRLTPAEARAILAEVEGGPFLAGVGDAAKWIALGVLGWAGLRTWRELRA